MTEKKYALSECFSRPGRLLTTHLEAVATNIAEQFPPQAASNYSTQPLLRCAIWSGLVHDIGKATSYFQDYVRGESDRDKLRHHSLVSSVFAYAGFPGVLGNHKLSDDTAALLTCGTILSVWRHHGNLYDLQDMVRDFVDSGAEAKRNGLLPQQLQTIALDEMNTWLAEKWEDAGLPGQWEPVTEDELLQLFEGFGLRRRWKKLARKQTDDLGRALTFLMQYGILIGHDKLHAALDSNSPAKTHSMSPGIVDYFRETKFGEPDTEMDELRAKLCSSVAFALEKQVDNRVFTLTAPTGSGKTLTGLETALRLRERKFDQNPAAPIIYCLPFTSIIDQNFDEIRKVLECNNLPDTSDVLLKHHHLAQPRYTSAEDDFDLDASSVLIEEWMSSMVVTTFEQFFRTLYHARNASGKRFHRLNGAVLLLDEVQAIPRRYWETVRRTLLHLARDWDTDIILMTATRPLILQPDDAVELVANQDELFEGLSRVLLHNRAQERTERPDFIDEITHDIASSQRSIGVVANTVACARSIYEHLRNVFPEREITYLSSHIVPVDRRQRIEQLRARDTPGILVSTQVIEAGVDISLDTIHRDFAPLDSIIQTAGRCNRTGSGEGEIVVWQLQDTEQYTRPYCQMIYDPLLLDATEKVIGDQQVIPEARFRDLGDTYFKELKRRGADAELHREFALLQFETVANNFELIQQLPGRQSYFVILNDEAAEIWEQYQQIQEMKPLDRRKAFLRMKRRFYERVINVITDPDETTDDIEPLYPDSSLPVYYDYDCGFMKGDSDATMFF